jgi:hypothetical protein
MNNFLAITYAFILAYCPCDNYGIGMTQETYRNSTHVRFEVGLQIIDHINLYAGEETLQVSDKHIFDWLPYTQSYYVGMEYEHKFTEGLNLKAGIRHKCQHPVDGWGCQLSQFNHAITEVYLGVSGKINVF